MPNHPSDAVVTASDTLAHVEEALDQLESAVHAVARSVEEREDGRDGADAEALRWHLVETGRRLRGALDSCRESRRWSRRLEDGRRAGSVPARGPVAQRLSPAAIPLCRVGEGAESHTVSALVDELTLTYDIVAVDPEGEISRLHTQVPTLREARQWARTHAGRRAGVTA